MARHLVIQLARFGDMVQTKRLLLSLAAIAEDEVHLAVDASLAPLARTLYPFAVVHEIRAHASGGAGGVFSCNREAFAALGALSFQSVYNLNFSGMSLALAGLFDPDSVRGYIRRKGQVLRSRWLRMGFRWMRERRVAPVNLVDFWAHLHPSPISPAMVNPKALPRENGTIAVVAAGRESRRSLPPEVFAPIVESAFAAHGGPEVVILGTNAERPFARKMARLFRPATVQKTKVLCGETSLIDLTEILAGCRLVLTPDTGIMHLAASMGLPVTAFFLSSAWCFETGPYGEGHTIFQATRSCAPCVESRPCPYGVACLPPFTSPEVASAIRGKYAASWPDDIAVMRSFCDDFGCDYVVEKGVFAENDRRKALRAVLSEYAGSTHAAPVPSWSAETVFHETDWMLPPEGEADFAEEV